MTVRHPEPGWKAFDFARVDLEAVQEREPHHAKIGSGRIADVCGSCSSRRDCRRASLALAVIETRVISNG
jgi:hypothetical protein